jgi:hypothetical protein
MQKLEGFDTRKDRAARMPTGSEICTAASFERAYLFLFLWIMLPGTFQPVFVELEPNARIAAAHGTPRK